MKKEKGYNYESYNGFKNYETWNVALWIGNDESLYHLAKQFRHARNPYQQFVASLRELGLVETPDKIAWNDSGLDIETLNEVIQEL